MATVGGSGNMQALVGTTQGNTYTLERLLHEGRDGSLFEAKQIRLGYRCTVRLLNIDPAQRKPLLAAFSQQAQIPHPGLCPIVDSMQLSDETLLIATPLLPGQDLSQRVAGQGKLSLAEGTAVLRTAAGALFALHQKGLCHGGVTGQSLLIVGFDDVAVDGALGSGQANQRAVLVDGGLYIARKESASAADDQAALAQLIEQTVSDLPPPLRAVLAQAQNPAAGKRYPTMQAFWQAAEAALGRKGAAAQPTAVVGAITLPKLQSGGSRWPLVLAAASFLILAVVVAMVGLRRPAAPSEPTKLVSKVAAEPEQVTIQLELSPDSAKVMLDGKVAHNPLKLPRSTSPVPLRIEAEGYLPATSKVVPDRDRSLHITLAPAAEAAQALDAAKKARKSRSKK